MFRDCGLALILLATGAAAQEAFTPASPQECLRATVRIRTTDADGKQNFGSGFFLNEGPTTYIYTNAHVIDGAAKIEVTDYSGAAVTGIQAVEAFAEPFGNSPATATIAGDGVRLKLSKWREIALTPATGASGLDKGSELLVLGDIDGAGVEVSTVKVTSVQDGIINYDLKPKPGASGGAIIDPQTFKVVGLHTWYPTTWGGKGFRPLAPNPFGRVFGIDEGGGGVFGVLLENPLWEKFATRDFLAQRKIVQRFRSHLEAMVLASYLAPSAPLVAGAAHRSEPDEFVTGGRLTEVLNRYKKEPSMRKLIELQAKKESIGGMKVSINDELKLYISTLDDILKERQAVLQSVRKDNLSYYHRSYLNRRLLTECEAQYAAWILIAQARYKQIIALGRTIPASEWENLPPIGVILATEIGNKLNEEK